MIIGWLLELVAWFWQLWNRLDEKTKRQIIETVVKAFEELLRSFYKKWKSQRNK